MAMLHLESAEPIVYDPPAEMVRDVSEADDLILPVVEPPAAVIIALANRVSRSELPEPLIEEAAPVATLESRRMKRRWFAGVDTNEVNELVVVSRSNDSPPEHKEAAIKNLLDISYSHVVRLACYLAGNVTDGVDVAQEAIIKAWKALDHGKFRGDAKFSTWLYKIVRNEAKRHQGKKHEAQELTAAHDEAPVIGITLSRMEADDPERNVLVEEHAALVAALGELSVKGGQVVVLSDVFGKPHKEIAAELGISEEDSRVTLHRARKKLRETLFPDNEKKTKSPRKKSSPRRQGTPGRDLKLLAEDKL